MPRAIIIGGSVGGLFAAHLLQRVGWEVVVFERATAALESRGAAIGFTEELIDLMRGLGLRLDLSLGIDLRSYVALDRAGAIVHTENRQSTTGAWAHVYQELRDALPPGAYRPGLVLSRFEQEGGTVTAIFADGSRSDGDLLLGADGAHSTVRRQMLPGILPQYAGYVVWRGIVAEPEVRPADRDLIFNDLVFCMPARELMLSIPIPGEDAAARREGNRRCCYAWYHPVEFDTELQDLCTDEQGRRHGTSIAPTLIRPQFVRALKDSAAELFPPVIADLVARVDQPMVQAIFDLEAPRLISGRAALLGDAAFVARPHVVAGVTKAALDAQCLAECLARDDIDVALAAYDRQRRDFGSRIVAHARRLGMHLAGDMPATPEFMLGEYGAPHLFRKTDVATRTAKMSTRATAAMR